MASQSLRGCGTTTLGQTGASSASCFCQDPHHTGFVIKPYCKRRPLGVRQFCAREGTGVASTYRRQPIASTHVRRERRIPRVLWLLGRMEGAGPLGVQLLHESLEVLAGHP